MTLWFSSWFQKHGSELMGKVMPQLKFWQTFTKIPKMLSKRVKYCCSTNRIVLCRFSMVSLSKFANCLTDQHLYHSPLMGHIAHILDQRLSSIDDAR